MRLKWKLALALALGAAVALSQIAVAQGNDAGTPVRTTVTAASKDKNENLPPLEKRDFMVYEGKSQRPVLNVVQQKGPEDKLDLYIVVDDSINTSVALNYPDVKNFVHELPTPARVGLLYTYNGTIQVVQDLTDDRDAALNKLRIPRGTNGVAGGIYLSLADLAKRLPNVPGRRYAILFLSSGIDSFRGLRSTSPGINPDLDLAIDRLNRAGITVYSIYVSPATHFGQSFWLVSNGQSCLSRLAAETGGEAYFQGFATPISMKPFLDEMQRHLANQYLVTFAATPRNKGAFVGLKVRTEVSGVELNSASRAWVPGSADKK